MQAEPRIPAAARLSASARNGAAVRNDPLRHDRSSVGGLLGRTIDLAQQVALDELRLLRLESREYTTSVLVRGALMAAAAVCIVFAWIALWATIVVALEPWLTLAGRLGIVTGTHFALGIGLLLWARRDPGAESES